MIFWFFKSFSHYYVLTLKARLWLFMGSVRETTSSAHNYAGNWVEKRPNLPGHFESFLSHSKNWRTANDANLLSDLSGRNIFIICILVTFQLIESAILACIFTKLLSTQDEEEQDAMLEYTDGVEKSSFQRQVR